jgi:hypothetical protein
VGHLGAGVGNLPSFSGPMGKNRRKLVCSAAQWKNPLKVVHFLAAQRNRRKYFSVATLKPIENNHGRKKMVFFL